MNDRFWDHICDQLYAYQITFSLAVLLLILLLISVPFLEWGSDSFAVTLMTLPVLGVLLLGNAFVIRTCRKRERRL